MDTYGYEERPRRQRYDAEMPTQDTREQAIFQGEIDAATGRRVFGQRGTITSRPSRESIMESYAAQDQARARSARMRNQESYKDFQQSAARNRERRDRQRELELRMREEERMRAEERRQQREQDQARLRSEAALEQRRGSSVGPRRVVEPLSSQESHDRYEMSRQAYERERQNRDVLSPERPLRGGNREVIDGRGSIDSRAFNERQALVSYSIDESDRPDPMIDASNPKAKWRSHSSMDVHNSQGFLKGGGRGSNVPTFSRSMAQSQRSVVGNLLDELPTFVKVVVPLILVLLIILLVIIFL